MGFGLGFAIGSILTTFSSDALEELELLLMRFLCRSGGLEGGRG